MKELKINPTSIEQVWHEVNFGDGLPKENGIYLVITHNRDYAIAYFAFKDEILNRDMNWIGDNIPDVSNALIANEDGFYTLSKKQETRKFHVTAWTKLNNPSEMLDLLLRKNK